MLFFRAACETKTIQTSCSEIEEGDDSDIEDPMSPIPGDVDNSQLVAQVEELQRQGQVAEAERIAAVNKMQVCCLSHSTVVVGLEGLVV